ncbi:unnamed protein product [Brassica oleracea var. botrytis]
MRATRWSITRRRCSAFGIATFSGNGFDNGRPNDETKRYAEVV